MKSRPFAICAAMLGISFLATVPGWAATQVKLSAASSPAEPGLTTIRLFGSGFPTGSSINPANIQVQLTPQGGGSTTNVTAGQYQAVVGTTGVVAFLVPPSISVSSPTVFTASLTDTTDGFSRAIL